MLDTVTERVIKSAIDFKMGSCFNKAKSFCLAARDHYAAAADGKITKEQMEADIAAAFGLARHGTSEFYHLLSELVTS